MATTPIPQFYVAISDSSGNALGVVTDSAGVSYINGREVKSAVISAASAGDNTLVAAVTGKKIRVHSLVLVNNHTAVQTIRFESGAGGTALTGQMILAANSGLVAPFDTAGHFETAAAALLNLELAGATAVGGWLKYTEVG